MQRHVIGLLSGVLALLATTAFAIDARAQNAVSPYRGDATFLIGGLAVDNGFDDRFLASAWGNLWLENGLGLHAETHYSDREETAGLFVGGLSWNSAQASFSLRGGTSTDNDAILPETYLRAEAILRSPPEDGWVFTPSATYREYRNTAEEVAIEAQVAKYVPYGEGAFILQGMARVTFIDPGDHTAGSFGGGVFYYVANQYQIGVFIEGGEASYEAALGGTGFIDENYISVRPSVSKFIDERVELIIRGEYTERDSFTVLGGYGGIKLYFD